MPNLIYVVEEFEKQLIRLSKAGEPVGLAACRLPAGAQCMSPAGRLPRGACHAACCSRACAGRHLGTSWSPCALTQLCTPLPTDCASWCTLTHSCTSVANRLRSPSVCSQGQPHGHRQALHQPRLQAHLVRRRRGGGRRGGRRRRGGGQRRRRRACQAGQAGSGERAQGSRIGWGAGVAGTAWQGHMHPASCAPAIFLTFQVFLTFGS